MKLLDFIICEMIFLQKTMKSKFVVLSVLLLTDFKEQHLKNKQYDKSLFKLQQSFEWMLGHPEYEKQHCEFQCSQTAV